MSENQTTTAADTLGRRALTPDDAEDLTLERIMEARGWDDQEYASRRIRDIVDNVRTRLESRLPEGSRFSFTALQRQALTTEGFWADWDEKPKENDHLIIQGATSSGKTLISELAILDVLCHQKKVIVLVPLRAMVHERSLQFKQDMDLAAKHYGVYGSSADYMDNDERIIAGEYDVAVIVYEKFFAMISSPECRVLDGCQLIIVDELSMLSKEERGPKLEISLEIVANRCPTARVMCLVTSDCKTELVAKWLHAPTVIRNLSRPVGLDEYVMRTDGHYYCRHIPGENECSEAEGEVPVAECEGELEIRGYNPEERAREQKLKALLAILERVHEEQPGSRVLVFVAGKADTARTAHDIRENASGLFPLVGIGDEMSSALANFEHDEDREDLEKNLLPYGIAYHHAGISTALRECIEEEFQRNGSTLKLIVATETLTIGINMPFDVMIMMDHKVPSGAGKTHTLTYQEYRNYIGRAGRLGQTNRCGTSYFIATDHQTQEYYWFEYGKVVRNGGDEIESSLKGSSLESKVPYLLALACDSVGSDALPRSDFEKRLELLHQKGFAYACGSQDFDACGAREQFKKHRLCVEAGENNPFGGEPSVSFTSFGEKAAPFALRLSTCQLIYNYFLMDTRYGLPYESKPTDIIEDRYLLEILYHLCNHEEVQNCGNLAIPERRSADARVAAAIPESIRAICGDGSGLWAFADDPFGSVRELDGSKSLVTEVQSVKPKLQAAVRAIVLYWWTKGESINKIRERSGLKGAIRITGGDVERLASVVSYHLDAIYHVMELAKIDEEVRRQLYWLQARIKYGMPRSGISLANKHVHGLDRPRILRFVKRCNDSGVSPLDALFTISDEEVEREHFFTHEQLILLRQRNAARRSGRRFELILEGAKSEANLTEEQMKCLEEIHNREALGALATLADLMFIDADRLGLPRVRWVGEGNRVLELSCGRGSVFIGAWERGAAGEVATVFKVQKQRGACVTCSIIGTQMDEVTVPACDLVLTKEFFDLLLVKAFAFEKNGIYAFVSFLFDARGTFAEHDWNSMSISDYFPRQECENPTFKLLAHQEDEKSVRALSIAALKDEMETTDDLNRFETMTFGSIDYTSREMMEGPFVISLTRTDVMRSEGATDFLFRMSQQGFSNCLVLVPSEEEARGWREGADPLGANAQHLDWYGGLCAIPESALRVAHDKDEAIDEIRAFLALWKREEFLVGVSFARFDPQGTNHGDEGDVARLYQLIERLSEHLGRHRILFCGFEEQEHYFQGRGARPDSIRLYEECALYIVLDNMQTRLSENCREERRAIDAQCATGHKACLYVRGVMPGGIATPDDYATPISIEPDNFVNLVVDMLGELGY